MGNQEVAGSSHSLIVVLVKLMCQKVGLAALHNNQNE
jgi:hypothetical protein